MRGANSSKPSSTILTFFQALPRTPSEATTSSAPPAPASLAPVAEPSKSVTEKKSKRAAPSGPPAVAVESEEDTDGEVGVPTSASAVPQEEQRKQEAAVRSARTAKEVKAAVKAFRKHSTKRMPQTRDIEGFEMKGMPLSEALTRIKDLEE